MVSSTVDLDLSVFGNIRTFGQLEVFGIIHGEVECSRLIVGEQGRIVGSVTAKEVIIRGTVLGNIRSTYVTLHAQSEIRGDIYYRWLDLKPGTRFDGKTFDLRAANYLGAVGMDPIGNVALT